MMADARSRALVNNFAAQWLHLRNLASITPDMRLFPDFDDNLRQAFRQETELFFDSVLREDRSVLDLLRANYTFVNERLAKHYGIPHVYGSQFRRIALDTDSDRGGLLRQGSILTVTSYATRTSPVIRGKWILDNLLGVPPPPPLPDVPALKDNTVDGNLSVRKRLAEHRSNAVCASCHNLMDPIGLSLEKFDAVGRRRTVERGVPIDASGGFPDGSTFTDVDGLEAALLRRPELFVGALYREAPDLRVRAWRRVLRCAGHSRDRAGRAVAEFPRVRNRPRSRQEQAVSDEDVTMIITKLALPRRTFLRGLGASVALPLLDAMVPSLTAVAKTAADPIRRLGFVYMPMGCDLPRWTPPGEGRLVELSPALQSLAPVVDQLTVISNLELKNAYPGNARDVQRVVPERGQGEVDREYGLPPRHDRRSSGSEADRPADAAAVARAVDGSAPDGRANATTATRASIRTTSRGRRRRRRCPPRHTRASSSSACSARAAVRRTVARSCGNGPACSIRFVTTSRACRRSSDPRIARESVSISRPSAKWSVAFRRRRRARSISRCRISIARWACRRPTPSMRS